MINGGEPLAAQPPPARRAPRQTELERRVETRRAADEAAEREAQRLEAEAQAQAQALSAALDDETLAGIVRLVTAGMAGPLAGSPMAVARAVLAWCGAAAARQPGRWSTPSPLAWPTG